MRSNVVFKVIFGVICLISVPLYLSVRRIAQIRCSLVGGSGSSCLSILDFWRSILVALLLISLRSAFLHMLTRKSHRRGSKRVISSQQKSSRFASALFKTLYFVSISLYGFIILRNDPSFPAELGGSGNGGPDAYLRLWSLDDNQYTVNNILLEWYFFVNAGYHFSSIFILISEMPHLDFWENCVQIFLALNLICFGYIGNHHYIGSLLMVLHDVCDIFTSLCKTLVATQYRRCAFGCGVLLIGLWGYNRLYCLGKIIILPVMGKLEKAIKYQGWNNEWGSFVVLLLCLFFMNIYWLSLLAKSCWIYVASGKVRDLHSYTPQLEDVHEENDKKSLSHHHRHQQQHHKKHTITKDSEEEEETERIMLHRRLDKRRSHEE